MRSSEPTHHALLAGLGGSFGALARWAITEVWPAPTHGFPLSTLLINLTGCLLLALLPLVPAVRREPRLAVLLGTGVLGGYTTMSSFSAQTIDLLQHGTGTALTYLTATVLGCLAAAFIGTRLVSRAEAQRFEEEEGDR